MQQVWISTSSVVDMLELKCPSLRCRLGSHGHDLGGENQYLRRECESREQGQAAHLQLGGEGGSIAVGRVEEDQPDGEKRNEA